MPPTNHQLLNIIANLARQENMKLETRTNVLKNFFCSATIILGSHCCERYFGSFIGSGYLDFVTGVMVGSFIAFRLHSKNKSRSLADILLYDTTVDQQALLIGFVRPVGVYYRTRIDLALALVENGVIRYTVIEIIEYFVEACLSKKYPGCRLTRKMSQYSLAAYVAINR